MKMMKKMKKTAHLVYMREISKKENLTEDLKKKILSPALFILFHAKYQANLLMIY